MLKGCTSTGDEDCGCDIVDGDVAAAGIALLLEGVFLGVFFADGSLFGVDSGLGAPLMFETGLSAYVLRCIDIRN